MPPLPPELRPGALVAGRYRLEQPLGSGGMADVWDATDERLHRRVALKVLRDGGTTEDAAIARRRFEAEGQLAARQIHRSIVTVFDAGEDDGPAYLVMERLSGETLADRLVAGALDDVEARALMGDVLAALDAAHRTGVVHRDIKPSNVLAVDGGRWKVADFGIAKSVDEVTSDRTLAGQVVGTPRFMAPERLAGLPATVASDTYSAGVLLREVLAGRSDADPDLLAVAERATAPDPSQRFASAAAMAAALDGGSATVVLPTEPAGQLRDTEAIGTVPLAAAGMPTRVDDAPPTRVLAVSGRGHPGRVVAAAIVALVLAGCVAAAAMRGSGGAEPTTREVVATSTPGNTPQTTVPPTSMPSTSTTASTSTSSTSTSTTTTEPVPPPGPKDGPGGKPKKEKGPGKGK